MGYERPKQVNIPSEGLQIFIPNPHGGKDIGIPLLKKIIRQIGITQDEFIKL